MEAFRKVEPRLGVGGHGDWIVEIITFKNQYCWPFYCSGSLQCYRKQWYCHYWYDGHDNNDKNHDNNDKNAVTNALLKV